MKIEDMRYMVIKTPCYPSEWYAGPVDYLGHPLDNATCNYYRTLALAEEALRRKWRAK